jgi:hypothetical protein
MRPASVSGYPVSSLYPPFFIGTNLLPSSTNSLSLAPPVTIRLLGFFPTPPPPLPKRFPNPVPIPCLVPLILTGVPKFNSNTAFSKNSQLRRSSLNYLYFYLDIGINLQPDSISLSHNHSSLYKPIWFEAKPPVTLRGILTQVSYR